MVGTEDELLPDAGPEAARDALTAASQLRVFDGRATCWLVVLRLVEVAGVAMAAVPLVWGGVLVGQWLWWVLAGGLLVVAAGETPLGRLAGAEPNQWRLRWRLLAVVLLLAAFAVVSAVTGGAWTLPLPAFVLLVALACYPVAPVVRWLLTSRDRGDAVAWPVGANAFAVLAVLSRARWVYPDRLAELTGMSREQCDAWVSACAARGLVHPPVRRAVLGRRAELTPAGRARLAAWTTELVARERAAATTAH